MKNIIKIFGIALFSLAGILVCGVTLAATVFDLQPAATITYNEDLTVNGIARFPKGVHIGQQGTGGVTYFNGTIVNQTTTNGADNPVTFGDNVRIDGEIWRTEKGGNNPIKVSDHVIPTTDNVNNFGSADHRWKNGYFSGALAIGSLVGNVVTSANIVDGTITEADLANNAVTTGKIKDGTITGSDVNTSTDMNFRNLNLSGNAVQARDKSGVVKGMVYVNDDGTCGRSYTYDGSKVSCKKLSANRFEITFNFKVNDRYWSATPVSYARYARAYATTEKKIQIDMWADDGSASSSDMMLIIY